MKNVMGWIKGHKVISIVIGFLVLPVIGNSIVSVLSPAPTPAPQVAAPAATTTVSAAVEQQRQEDAAAEKAAQAAFDSSPAGRICKAHPTWQQAECQELADGKLWITTAAHPGMTYDMLVYLRGEADNTNVSDSGSGKEYQYCWDGYTPSCFYDRNDDGRMDAYN